MSDAPIAPVGWRYVPSDVWGSQVLTQDPKTAKLAIQAGRDVEPLFTKAQMDAKVAAERERWEEALRRTWRMVDPLKPAGTPGSYARGQDSGIVAALNTIRANLKP